MERRPYRRGFTLIEMLVVIAVIALLIGILLPALGEAKRLARRTISESNQRNLAIASVNYSSDFKGLLPSFTWRPWDARSEWRDLNLHYDDWVTAAANQAVDIMRRRADLEPRFSPPINSWIPHVLYTHLVLNDFLAQRLPEKMVVNPEDRNRLCWQRFPRRDGNDLEWQLKCTGPGGIASMTYRWAYSSSYQFIPASYSRDVSTRDSATVSQGGTHRMFRGGDNLGGRTYAEVPFPQQKVLLHDSYARHSGPFHLYYAYREAVQPVGFVDGSVRRVKTGQSNEGHNPNRPWSDSPTLFYYQPFEAWEAPTKSGLSRDQVAGWYRWCRAGLRGIDIGSNEVRTGNPGEDDDRDGLP